MFTSFLPCNLLVAIASPLTRSPHLPPPSHHVLSVSHGLTTCTAGPRGHLQIMFIVSSVKAVQPTQTVIRIHINLEAIELAGTSPTENVIQKKNRPEGVSGGLGWLSGGPLSIDP